LKAKDGRGERKQVVDELFIVRLYDMFDGWIDITKPVTKEEADRVWNEHTENGTENTKYADGDYYAIFPADTRMLFTPETLGR
jgi:hypothetical protein